MGDGTIFALSSGRPPAAISVIRISGDDAHRAAELVAGTLPEPRTARLCEFVDPDSGELIDHGLVLRFDGPASATGEDIIELQCHGGRAIVDRLLAALAQITGLREAAPGEFTRRAFENGRIDLTEAEGLADLIEAETESQRKAALMLAEGGLRREITGWQERLLALSAIAERAIDHDEDDLAPDPRLVGGCGELAAELREWLGRPRIEPLKNGVRVVIAGPPNAGKSSLINVIAGQERVIVSDRPGTTRDHIDVPLSLGGLPINLTDTAGLRETMDEVEAIGIERASRLVSTSDVVVWLGSEIEAPDHPRLIMVRAKADLLVGKEKGAVLPGDDGEFLAVSSVSKVGVQELLKRIESCARTALPGEDRLALNRRQASLLEEAEAAIDSASRALDVLLIAEDLRHARSAFDRLTGRAGVEDVLDALFSRFCLGK